MRYFQEPDSSVANPKFPCGKCNLIVRKNHKAVQCDLCNYWTHIKCDGLDSHQYDKLKSTPDNESLPYFCKICSESIFPFQRLTDEQYIAFGKGIDLGSNNCLNILPNSRLKTFYNNLNNIKQTDKKDDEFVNINCKYYDVDKCDFKNIKGDRLSLFHLNIASLGAHKDELENMLSILNTKFDILGLTETKIIKDKPPIYDTSILGYDSFHTCTESNKGGTSIYVNKKFESKARVDLSKILYVSKKLESTFVELLIKGKKNIIVGCIYKHPFLEIDEFNTLFNKVLDKISRENKDVFLLGDFNIDLLKVQDDNNIDDYYNILCSNFLIPHITLPTRITPRSETLIDNIFSNNTEIHRAISGNLTISISDHLPQFCIMPRGKIFKPKKQIIFQRPKTFDNENLVSDFINVDWNSTLEIHAADPIASFEKFKNKVDEIVDFHLPLKKLSKKEMKLDAKPWITIGIRKSMQRRDHLLNKYINSVNKQSASGIYDQYKQLRNQIVSLLKISKKNHYQKYFSDNFKNIRKTWEGIKSIINIHKISSNQPSSMNIDGEISNDPIRIANGFNNYFADIGTKLQNKIHTSGSDFSNYLKTPNANSLFLESVDSQEILLIIDAMDCHKASGPQSIPTNVLKLVKNNICFPLKELINLSLATGVYPDQLKQAKVIPIFKNKDDPLFVCNYRPISLLSNINKIFEKLVYKRVYSFLVRFNCIYELQFGFQEKHSTNHALISLTESIRDAMDKGLFACGVFIDLQKAFDTVDHTILLKKLEYYGIKGIANDWFKSYLSGRTQFTSVNGYNSELRKIKIGVPQGSVLGPLLFLIYINDLHCCIKYSSIHHFADDTNLFVAHDSIKTMQKQVNLDLKILCKWLRANKISLNASKTEVLIFKHPNKQLLYSNNYNEKVPFDIKIKIDGKKIKPSSYVKYLGILIDSQLNWNFHVDNLSTKLSRASGMLSKVRYYVNQKVLISIYNGIFSSLISYGSQIWGQNSNIQLKIKKTSG